MRRLTRRRHEAADRGAVLVWVGLMLAVLVGAGALVIEVGALYLERRQLQNGADAGALAVAQECAEGDCSPDPRTAAQVADALADVNADDGAATVSRACGEGPGLDRDGCAEPDGLDGALGWVHVETQTHNPANSDDSSEIGFVLAPAVGSDDGRTVTASASAAWGPANEVEGAVPMAMSTCALTDDGGPPPPGTLPTGRAIVYFHRGHHDQRDATDCGSAGWWDWWPDWPWAAWDWRDHRVGFGWLDGADDCARAVRVGDEPDGGSDRSDPGEVGCDPTEWRNRVLVVPVYDEAEDAFGQPTEYHISGFVGFRVTAYFLGGERWGSPDCDWWLLDRWDDWPCIEGVFTPITTAATTSGGVFADVADYGVRTVQMVDGDD